MVYSTSFGTEKSRCVVFDDGEEEQTSNGLRYFKIECQYLDYDGRKFEKASIDLVIVEFREKKRISTLKAFSLQYHPDENGIKAHLSECGQKHVSMLCAHHRHCRGKAFHMKEGEAVMVSVYLTLLSSGRGIEITPDRNSTN